MHAADEFVLVAELSGAALDYAVAQAIGLEVEIHPPIYGTGPRLFVPAATRSQRWWPSTDCIQGWQLLTKVPAQVRSFVEVDTREERAIVRVISDGVEHWQAGDTALIALCRAVVHAKSGAMVPVPASLLKEVANG